MQNEDVARALSEVWGFQGTTEHTKNNELRYAEPIIHEIAHALSLGFAINDKAPERTSRHFERLNDRSKLLGLVTEAHAFAIEQRILRNYGWLRFVDYTALMKDVHATGYSGPCVSYKRFNGLYRRFLQEDSTYQHAAKAIMYIERCVVIYKRLEKKKREL